MPKNKFNKLVWIFSVAFVSYVTYFAISNLTTQKTKCVDSTRIVASKLFQSDKVGFLPSEIKGKIITLKKIDLKYLNQFHDMFSDVVRENIEYPKKITLNFSKRLLIHDMNQEKKGVIIVYFIFDNNDKKLIGIIEIKDKNDKDPGQFSIWINENYWGGNRAQEATKIISDLYFKYKDENEFIANVRLWNKRSYKALLKAGFIETGKYYEDGKPTRYILKMYRSKKTNSKSKTKSKNNSGILIGNTKNKGVKKMADKKKILFILIPKFRDEEFATPYKMMYEKGYILDVAGVKPGEIVGANGYKKSPDLLLDKLSFDDMKKYDALVIPGGPGSTTYIWGNKRIQDIVEFFNSNKKLVATICFACIAPAEAGILKGKEATVYPTAESKDIFKKNGVSYRDQGIVVLNEDNIITAQGPMYAKQFGEAIINFLESK